MSQCISRVGNNFCNLIQHFRLKPPARTLSQCWFSLKTVQHVQFISSRLRKCRQKSSRATANTFSKALKSVYRHRRVQVCPCWMCHFELDTKITLILHSLWPHCPYHCLSPPCPPAKTKRRSEKVLVKTQKHECRLISITLFCSIKLIVEYKLCCGTIYLVWGVRLYFSEVLTPHFGVKFPLINIKHICLSHTESWALMNHLVQFISFKDWA